MRYKPRGTISTPSSLLKTRSNDEDSIMFDLSSKPCNRPFEEVNNFNLFGDFLLKYIYHPLLSVAVSLNKGLVYKRNQEIN